MIDTLQARHRAAHRKVCRAQYIETVDLLDAGMCDADFGNGVDVRGKRGAPLGGQCLAVLQTGRNAIRVQYYGCGRDRPGQGAAPDLIHTANAARATLPGGVLADRFGARRVTVAGLAFAFIGFSLVSTLEADTTALGFVLRFVFVGLGMATFQTPNNTAIMGSAPDGRSGVTGALLGLTRAFGQSGGIAVLGTFWAARVVARAGGEAGDVGQAVLTQARVGAVHDVMHVVQVLVAASLAIAVWDLWRRSARRAGAVGVTPAAHD